jgi:V-type H+-transporting ATPase subunit E
MLIYNLSEQSQNLNRLRLQKLKVKIECVNNVFDEARVQLINRIKGKSGDYKTVLKNLIIQGLIKLLEENVSIFCKKEDYDVVNSVIDQAKNEFLDLLKRESKKYKNFNTNIIVDTKYYLPETV